MRMQSWCNHSHKKTASWTCRCRHGAITPTKRQLPEPADAVMVQSLPQKDSFLNLQMPSWCNHSHKRTASWTCRCHHGAITPTKRQLPEPADAVIVQSLPQKDSFLKLRMQSWCNHSHKKTASWSCGCSHGVITPTRRHCFLSLWLQSWKNDKVKMVKLNNRNGHERMTKWKWWN